MLKELYYGYARVSTDEQGKTGFSIEEQVADLQSWSEKFGQKFEEIYVDKGQSASTLKRKGLQQLIKAVATDPDVKKYIVIRHSDRLTRSLENKTSLKYVFTKYNVHVISFWDAVDFSDPDKDLQTTMRIIFNESEIKKIPAKVIEGYKGSARLGNYSIGSVPKGYKRSPNIKIGKGSILVPMEGEAEVIVQLFETLASNSITVTDMVKILNKENLLGTKWTDEKLLRILDNPIYYGRFKTKWFDSAATDIGNEYKSFWHDPDHHTWPLISEDLWLRVQAAIHCKKKYSKHHYYFQHLVFCTECRCFATHKSAWKTSYNGKSKKLHKYYYCEKCNKRINESKIIDEYIANYVVYETHQVKKDLITDLQNKISKLRTLIDILNQDFENDLFNVDEYRIQVAKHYNKIKFYNEEIAKITSASSQKFVNLSDLEKSKLVTDTVDIVMVSFKYGVIDIKFKNKA